MDNRTHSDEVDVFVERTELDPQALIETSRFIAKYKQRPTYQAELEEARKRLADAGLDPDNLNLPDPKALLDHWHRCLAELHGDDESASEAEHAGGRAKSSE